MCDDAGHASRFPKLFMKLRLAPVGRAILAGRDYFQIRYGFIACDEIDAIIRELSEHRFVGIAIVPFIGNGDFASKPCLAMVIGVNGRRGGWMMIPFLAIGEPDGNNETTISQGDSMARTGSDYFPVVLRTKWKKCVGDFDGVAPGDSIVGASHVKASRVINAVQKLDRPGGWIDDRDRVVDRLFFFATLRLGWITFDAIGVMGDMLWRLPCDSTIK